MILSVLCALLIQAQTLDEILGRIEAARGAETWTLRYSVASDEADSWPAERLLHAPGAVTAIETCEVRIHGTTSSSTRHRRRFSRRYGWKWTGVALAGETAMFQSFDPSREDGAAAGRVPPDSALGPEARLSDTARLLLWTIAPRAYLRLAGVREASMAARGGRLAVTAACNGWTEEFVLDPDALTPLEMATVVGEASSVWRVAAWTEREGVRWPVRLESEGAVRAVRIHYHEIARGGEVAPPAWVAGGVPPAAVLALAERLLSGADDPLLALARADVEYEHALAGASLAEFRAWAAGARDVEPEPLAELIEPPFETFGSMELAGSGPLAQRRSLEEIGELARDAAPALRLAAARALVRAAAEAVCLQEAGEPVDAPDLGPAADALAALWDDGALGDAARRDSAIFAMFPAAEEHESLLARLDEAGALNGVGALRYAALLARRREFARGREVLARGEAAGEPYFWNLHRYIGAAALADSIRAAWCPEAGGIDAEGARVSARIFLRDVWPGPRNAERLNGATAELLRAVHGGDPAGIYVTVISALDDPDPRTLDRLGVSSADLWAVLDRRVASGAAGAVDGLIASEMGDLPLGERLRLLRALPEPAASDGNVLVRRGQLAYEAGEYAEAAQAFRRAVDGESRVDYRVWAGVRRADWKESLDVLVADAQPTSVAGLPPVVAYAVSARRDGGADEAAAVIVACRADRDPAFRGVALEIAGRPDDAIRAYRDEALAEPRIWCGNAVVSRVDDLGLWLRRLAGLLEAGDRVGEAFAVVRHAQERHGRTVEAFDPARVSGIHRLSPAGAAAWRDLHTRLDQWKADGAFIHRLTEAYIAGAPEPSEETRRAAEEALRGLASADPAEREAATDRLRGLGPSAIRVVEPALRSPDPEAATRVRLLLLDWAYAHFLERLRVDGR